MKKAAGLLLIIFFNFPFVIWPQGIPILEINPNPQAYGLGMAGVSLPSDDPLGFAVNPAMLGYSSQTNSLAFQIYSQKTDWPELSPATFNNMGITAGYNFSRFLNGLNLSAGLGFILSQFDYGYYQPGDGDSRIYQNGLEVDQYNAYGIGLSLDYAVNLSVGFTFKSFYSAYHRTKFNVFDLGLLLNIPVSKLTFNNVEFAPVKNILIKPVLDFSIGYSRSNIGNELNYSQTSAPLPLTARLGYTISIGSNILINSHKLNLFNLDITVEAEDLLVSSNSQGVSSYQGLLGDIKPGVNLIQGKGTENIVLRKGQKICLFETVSLLYGAYYGGNDYYFGDRTSGFVLSTNGLFKFLSWNINDNNTIKFFFDHFEIKYVNASMVNKYSIPGNNYEYQLQTDVKSVSISFSKFTF